MKRSPRFSRLSAVNSWFSNMGIACAVVLALSSSVSAQTPVSIYQSCQSGNAGDLLTASIMNASSYPSGSAWTAFVGSVWVSTTDYRNLPGPVSVNGTVYNGTGGTRTWTYYENNQLNCVSCNVPTVPVMSVGCYYASGYTYQDQIDTVCITGSNDAWGIIQTDNYAYPTDKTHVHIRVEAGTPTNYSAPDTGGSDIPLNLNQVYWVTLQYDGTTGITSCAAYDPSNGFAQVGTTQHANSSGSTVVSPLKFGRCDGHGNFPSVTSMGYIGQILIDYTNGVFPLLPSESSDVPTAPPNVYDGTTTGVETPYTTSTTQLSANWTAASDPQSGISGYVYAIGTTTGATNVVGWTTLGNVLTVTKTSLSLTNGQKYYFSVKAFNGNGVAGPSTNSTGQTVDTTPPTAPPAVYDGTTTGVETSTTTSTTQLSANWSASTDSISGISGYQYAIGTTAGGTNVVGWTSVGNVLSVTKTSLSLTVGTTYYFSVKATDNAGLVGSATNSSGCTVQTSGTTIYFQDNFENWSVYGGAWSSVNGVNSSHTLNTSTVEAAGGTHSLQLYGVDVAGQNGAYLTENFSPVISGGINVRFFVFLPTGFGTANSTCLRRVLRTYCGSNYGVITLTGDTPCMQVSPGWNGVYPGALTENTWHCLEMHIDPPSSSTLMQFWVDGVSAGTFSGNLSGSSTFNQIQFGDVVASSSGGNGTATFYVDELVVANSYIGTTIQTPAAYFSDNFESWSSWGGAWSSVVGGSTLTLNTSTTEAAKGTHSLMIIPPNAGYLTKTISPTVTGGVYTRFYVFLPTGWEEANEVTVPLLYVCYGGTNKAGRISLQTDGTRGGRVVMEETVGWTGGHATPTLTENAWHYVELYIGPPSTTTTLQAWVDGTQMTTTLTSNLSSSGCTEVVFGNFGGYGNSGPLYLDEIICSGAYNGP